MFYYKYASLDLTFSLRNTIAIQGVKYDVEVQKQGGHVVKPDQVVKGHQTAGETLASENCAIGRSHVERGINTCFAKKGVFSKRFLGHHDTPFLDDVAFNTMW